MRTFFIFTLIVSFTLITTPTFAGLGFGKKEDTQEKVDLAAALSQGQQTMTYIGLAMDYSLESFESLLPLMGDEHSEQRKQTAARLAELRKSRENGHLDADTIQGVNTAGEEIRAIELQATAERKQTEKSVRKAHYMSGLVLAMDVTAAVHAQRDANLLKAGLEQNKGMKALKNPTIRNQVKEAKDLLAVISAFTRALPVQKENFTFVRKNCKQFSEDLSFSLPAEVDPATVQDAPSASQAAEEEID